MTKAFILLVLCFIKPVNHKSTNATNVQSKHVLKTGLYYIVDEKNNYLRQLEKSNERYYINPDQIVSIKHFSKIDMGNDALKRPILVSCLDSIGTKEFSVATTKSINKKLALIIDDKLVCVPKVPFPITNGKISLAGAFTRAELEAFEKKMKAEM